MRCCEHLSNETIIFIKSSFIVLYLYKKMQGTACLEIRLLHEVNNWYNNYKLNKYLSTLFYNGITTKYTLNEKARKSKYIVEHVCAR